MFYNESRLYEALKKEVPVYCFYGLNAYLLQHTAQKVLAVLAGPDAPDTEITRLEPPADRSAGRASERLDLGELEMAAGAMSLFGTRRVLWLPLVKPSEYPDKELDAFCDLLASAENAVFVITILFKDAKSLKNKTKRAERFIGKCEALGYAAQLQDPTPRDIEGLLIQHARQLDTVLPPAAANAMIQRCGKDLFLLENELNKLAAASNYTKITPDLVGQMGTQSLEADAFELTGLLARRDAASACLKLRTLRRAQNDPIAITGALISNYIDLYRVKAGQEKRRPYGTVYRDFAYSGNAYRLEKAAERAAPYTRPQLAESLRLLQELDTALKSSPVDKDVLMEQTLCQLARLAGPR